MNKLNSLHRSGRIVANYGNLGKLSQLLRGMALCSLVSNLQLRLELAYEYEGSQVNRCHMQRLHLFLGILSLGMFIVSGLHMHFSHDHLRGMTDTLRLQFRSTHIYLLFGALINLALGIYLRPNSGWRSRLQFSGSLIVLTTPVFASIAFFNEPWASDLERPWSRAAAYGCLAGMMMHFISSLGQTRSCCAQNDKMDE